MSVLPCQPSRQSGATRDPAQEDRGTAQTEPIGRIARSWNAATRPASHARKVRLETTGWFAFTSGNTPPFPLRKCGQFREMGHNGDSCHDYRDGDGGGRRPERAATHRRQASNAEQIEKEWLGDRTSSSIARMIDVSKAEVPAPRRRLVLGGVGFGGHCAD